jgi:hypothetical protein
MEERRRLEDEVARLEKDISHLEKELAQSAAQASAAMKLGISGAGGTDIAPVVVDTFSSPSGQRQVNVIPDNRSWFYLYRYL